MLFFFSLDKIKNSLEQMKNEIGSISKKLNNLETSATKDEGQFPDSCYSLNVLNRILRRTCSIYKLNVVFNSFHP